MSSKTAGYILGGLQIVAGAVLSIVTLGAGAPAGAALIVSGIATIAGTALMPSPARPKDALRDSPTYGIDQFDNPRGSEALVPILYGEHRVKPVVISESVSSIAENNAPGVDAQQKQAVKWLGVVAEGEIESITDIEINDRPALSELRTDVEIGRGNGSKKEFTFSQNRVYLGTDESPEVEVFVAGVRRSWASSADVSEFVVPATGSSKNFDVIRDDKTDRILERSVRVYIRGPGHPQAEQAKRSGVYRWGSQKLSPWKLRIRFRTRPAAGFTIRVEYTVLRTSGLAIVQTTDGTTKAVFGTAPANGARISANYRTTPFHGLQIRWRAGTLDQSPIEGFTDTEQSRNPKARDLLKDAPLEYSTDGREVDDLRIGITAPSWVQYKSDGTTAAIKANVRVEYRRETSSAWTILRSGSGTEFGLVAEKASAIRWEIGIRDELERRFIGGDASAGDLLANFERAAYRVRVTRTSAKNNDQFAADDLSFAYVTEITREGFSYPGTALLGIKLLPSAAVNGQALRVSCVARRAALYDPREAGGSRDIGSSRNPALAIRDLITSSEGEASERFGAGHFFTSLDIFTGGDDSTPTLNSLNAFADFADDWVHRPGDNVNLPASATNGERRCRLNVSLDTPQSLMETVGDIAFLGYCFASLQGARWRFPLDKAGDAVFEFVDDVEPASQNCDEFVLRLDEWAKTPTAIQGSFWNEALSYERDELMVPVTDLPEDTPTNVRAVDLRGCTRETEGARMLRHLAEQAREMPFPCSWRAHPGAQRVEAGDIVTVRTRVPYSTGANATTLKVRVLAIMAGRDDEGEITMRYAGRVMASQSYELKAVAVPASAPIPPRQPDPTILGFTATVVP